MHLTPREISVTRLISQGKCNKDIAAELNLAEGTIKCYVSRIFEKLHFTNRYELGLWVHGYLDPQSNDPVVEKFLQRLRP